MIKKWMIPLPEAIRPCPRCTGPSIGITAMCAPRGGVYDYWNEWICNLGHVWRGGVIDMKSIQEVRPAEAD